MVTETPVELHDQIYVQRDDLYYPFTKMRGVRAHLATRSETEIGVLDSRGGRNGLAVTIACNEVGKQATVFWPRRKADTEPPKHTAEAGRLGARLVALPAGRQFILQAQAKRTFHGYMLPNGLKLMETVFAVASIVSQWSGIGTVVVPAGTGTIGAGVVRGLEKGDVVFVSSLPPRWTYLGKASGKSLQNVRWEVWTRREHQPPWPCDPRYEHIAWDWLQRHRRTLRQPIVFWSAG